MNPYPPRFLTFIAFLVIGLVSASSVINATAPLPPAADAIVLPVTVNTNSVYLLVDGNGTIFIAGRATSGEDRGSAVVYRVDPQGAVCVLCGLDGAYGSPTVTIRGDGRAYMTSIDSAGRVVRTWQVPEFVPISFNSRAATLPLVTTDAK